MGEVNVRGQGTPLPHTHINTRRSLHSGGGGGNLGKIYVSNASRPIQVFIIVLHEERTAKQFL